MDVIELVKPINKVTAARRLIPNRCEHGCMCIAANIYFGQRIFDTMISFQNRQFQRNSRLQGGIYVDFTDAANTKKAYSYDLKMLASIEVNNKVWYLRHLINAEVDEVGWVDFSRFLSVLGRKKMKERVTFPEKLIFDYSYLEKVNVKDLKGNLVEEEVELGHACVAQLMDGEYKFYDMKYTTQDMPEFSAKIIQWQFSVYSESQTGELEPSVKNFMATLKDIMVQESKEIIVID